MFLTTMTLAEKPYKRRISVLFLGYDLDVHKVRLRPYPAVRHELLASPTFQRG